MSMRISWSCESATRLGRQCSSVKLCFNNPERKNKMRLQFVYAGIVLFACILHAQSPATPPKLELRGDRFKPLTWEQLTPEQKTLVEHIRAGERTALTGPFNVLLRSPEMGDLAQKFGAETRFHSSIPRPLNEFAI